MTKTKLNRERLSIDVLPEEHKQIKVFATMHGESMREYVLQSIKKRMAEDAKETQDLLKMTTQPSKSLKDVWDNKEDARYDST